MSEFFDHIPADQADFIARQPVFFVATAAPDARINLSPKGMDTFRVLSPNRVAWLDYGGSGNETNAHLLADGRMTVMFCAFDRPALIYTVSGTIMEYRSDCAVPVTHKGGEISREADGISHYWINKGKVPVVLLSSDVHHGM